MDASIDEIELVPDLDPRAFVAAIRRPRTTRHLLLRDPRIDVSAEVVERMVRACPAPMAATASPVPIDAAGQYRVVEIALDERLPPAPSLALACPSVCVVRQDAVDSVSLDDVMAAPDLHAAIVRLSQVLVRAGWRHVAAPGTALSWVTPASESLDSQTWTPSLVASINGGANSGLETHVGWAATRLRPPRVIVDGACLTGSIHNGSQLVVRSITRALKRVRPEAHVALAVRADEVETASAQFAHDGIDVVSRHRAESKYDVVYRPYQLLDPVELPWLVGAGRRLMVAQLDLIAFSNPTYHPSDALFHSVRNLQRRTMRLADGVGFISEFGMSSSLAECPDLHPERCFVLSCGTDDIARHDSSSTPDELIGIGAFVTCISATFWHKNRVHAIEVFDRLCRLHGYAGSLVIAGPEPYYGSSSRLERQTLASLPSEVTRRVIHMGQVDPDTKWWLLRNADLVLYPSVVEGFGLVPFEAAAVGTPSLSHDGSALHEVIGPGPGLVSSWDPERWAAEAAAVVASQAAGDAVVDHVNRAAALYTWDRAARLTWDAFDDLLARPRSSLFREEGDLRSRISGESSGVASGAVATHFANRVDAYARRRMALSLRKWRRDDGM